jgi:hypothetical protein
MPEIPETRTYTGSCHCGAVRYRAEMALGPVVSCNCSICSRMGWLLAFVPADRFELLSGEDALSDYQFNTRKIHHRFCSRCGIRSFCSGVDRDGNEIRGINVRCLEGVDIGGLAVKKVDGARL